MVRILIVEDNPDFRKGAKAYFSRTRTSVSYAADYNEAMRALEDLPHGAIIDCFFPKNAGSGDTSLAEKAMRKLGVYNKEPSTPGKALTHVEETLGLPPEVTKRFAKNAGVRNYASEVGYRRIYERAIAESEANQPLGILVAEKAQELHVPLVLATSTHHHDEMTQPIQDLAGKRGWTLVDCAPEKAGEKTTPEFWQRAYEALKREMTF